MKSCDSIEKLITLSDIDGININEKEAIAKHLEHCESCSKKAKSMDKYYLLIQSLQNFKPALNDASNLTDSIINAISDSKDAIINGQKGDVFAIKPIYYRVAATILVLIMAGYYVQQSLYVSQLELSLKLTYANKNANKSLINSYNECLNYSENFIKEQASTDTHFYQLLLTLSQKRPLKSYKNYASAICLKSNAEFNSADLEMKKKMIVEFLNSNLKQNH